MTDGLNLDGFTANRHPAGTTPWPAASQSPASGGDFGAGLGWPAAQDVSSQGNAGLNQEGSSSAGESANDASERM
jgi:hypothetical protein